MHELDRVEVVTVVQGAKRSVLRTKAHGCLGLVCKPVDVALPPLVRQTPATQPPPPPEPRTARRRHRHRGATLPLIS
jgi:hypothetical protein